MYLSEYNTIIQKKSPPSENSSHFDNCICSTQSEVTDFDYFTDK